MKRRAYKRAIARSFSPAVKGCKFSGPSRQQRTMIETGITVASPVLAPSEEELSALPIWTFTLGVFALLTFGLTALPSIICGHLALARERACRRRSFAKSVALAGLVIGYVGVAVFGTWTVVLVRHLWQ